MPEKRDEEANIVFRQ